MTLFKGKYRVESARLRGWDYASAGWYFVTLCTRNRECVLGEVVNGVVRLSPIGETVAEEWRKTEQVRANVALDEWVIMPNHVHGIIVIKNNPIVETPRVETPGVETPGVEMPGVETPGVETPGVETPRVETPGVEMPGVETPRRGVSTLKPDSLGSIIGQIKSVCTKRIWAAGFSDFNWQTRFYDHIIRSEQSLKAIREYIANNPLNWERDKDNVEGLRM